MSQIEEWRPIKGFKGLYEISSLGRVKSLARKKVVNGGFQDVYERIKAVTHTRGYAYVGLHKKGKCYRFQVHRLVAIAFIKNRKHLPQVDHINRIRDDNRVENLRWCSGKENCNFEGTIEARRKACPRGKAHFRARAVLNATTNKLYETMSCAAKAIGVSKTRVFLAVRNNRKLNNCYWRYA